jgi:ElaB/YqjD/DUF883 family membrane-anchored ribosome-binding protein
VSSIGRLSCSGAATAFIERTGLSQWQLSTQAQRRTVHKHSDSQTESRPPDLIAARESSMTTSEETEQLQAELEESKQHLREDLSEIEDKLHRARARLSPARFITDKPLLALGVSFALGFILSWMDVSIEDLGKPVARTMLKTAGKEIAAQAIQG